VILISNRRGLVAAIILLVLVVVPLVSEAVALGETPEGEAETVDVDDAVLSQGSDAYGQSCSSCHQPGGVGLPGQFPPLVDNPRVQDTMYLETVITDGLEGEIEVLGIVYDGRMPSFSTLPEDDVAAIVAYVQSGFAVPSVPAAAPEVDSDAVSSGVISVVLLVALGVGVVVLFPQIVGANDRLETSWLAAWSKAIVIVVWIALFTVLVPNWVLQSETVAKMDDVAQDLIGVGLWALGLGLALWGLWWAHGQKRV